MKENIQLQRSIMDTIAQRSTTSYFEKKEKIINYI